MTEYEEDEGPRCASEVIIKVMSDEPMTVRDILEKVDLGCSEVNALGKINKALAKMEKNGQVAMIGKTTVKRGNYKSAVGQWVKLEPGDIVKLGCSFRQPHIYEISGYSTRYGLDCACGTTIFGNTQDECKETWLKHIKGEIE